MKFHKLLSMSMVVCLSACVVDQLSGKNNLQPSNTQKTQSSNITTNPPLAVALQANIQEESQLAFLNKQLARKDLSATDRAQMFFQRGEYYGILGLHNLARVDFAQSLNLNPAQPEIFNLLGIYYTQIAQFDAAFDAFDHALELDKNHPFASRNRAIAFYYGNRPELALEGIKSEYKDNKEDPFLSIWYYIIENELHPEQALLHLRQRYDENFQKGEWGWLLVTTILEKYTDQQLFEIIRQMTTQLSVNNAILARWLTEAYFYRGKRYEMEGDDDRALDFFKLALSMNVHEYVEYQYSILEVTRIYKKKQLQQRAPERNAKGKPASQQATSKDKEVNSKTSDPKK